MVDAKTQADLQRSKVIGAVHVLWCRCREGREVVVSVPDLCLRGGAGLHRVARRTLRRRC